MVSHCSMSEHSSHQDDPVTGYDTASFLLAFSRFTADFGCPALVVSDPGSQLKKASHAVNQNQSTDSGPNLEWDKIREAAAW